MLELAGVSKHFGGVRALDGVDLAVREGEIFGLIGPNGSGKSTLVNLVCGLFPPTSGRMLFRGREIGRLPAHARVRLGISRTFQNIRLFGQLSVWQNLWVAQNAAAERRDGSLRRWLGGPGRAREELSETLEFAGLAGKRDELAGNLAFGEQRRLELARALAELSEEEREAIALRYGGDLTVPEIARLTGERLTTVEGRVYRGLRKLRDLLAD